jgi:hypothetical protein
MRFLILQLFLLLQTSVKAQTNYDVFTYTEPKGYKKEIKTGYTSYTKSDNKSGTYCIISLYSQSLSSGNLAKDFDNDWATLVATPLGVTNAPEKDKGDEITGWKTFSGAANFELSGSTSMALLTTAKKEDANIAILVVTNSQSLLTTDVDAFYATLKLGAPLKVAVAQNNKPANNNAGDNVKPTSIIGEWLYDDALISVLYYGNGYSDTYNNNVKMTIKNKLTIKADGTYEDYTFYNKGTFKKKEITARGKYKLSGTTITFTPNYHQYIKNDVVQPKDDARNLRPSSATYSFVYDEKAKAWGVQFKAADADSYFPEEVYLKADAYKKNTTTTPPVSNNTKTTTTKSNSKFGARISGVWVSYTLDMLSTSMTWNTKVFFNNGTFLEGTPSFGCLNFKEDENNKLGTYLLNGNKGTIKMPVWTNAQNIDLVKPNHLKIGSESFFKSDDVNGKTIDGSFTSYATSNFSDVKAQPVGNRSVINFYSNGTFYDEGIFKYFLQSYGTQNDEPGKGTYSISEYTITLKYNNGKTRTATLATCFGATLANVNMIRLENGTLNKLK